jgi:hypothetical protein
MSLWSQVGQAIDGEFGGDLSGFSVSLSNDGTIVAIGAPNNGGVKGQVRVYKLSGSTWSQLGTDIDGTEGYSGYSVSLNNDGTILAVGAPDAATYRGVATVYQWNGTSWIQLGNEIMAPDYYSFSATSLSLSSSGTRIAIGTPGYNGNLCLVSVFQLSGSTWNQLGGNINGETSSDRSGQSVSLNADGTIVAIGSPSNSGGKGNVRVYQYSSGSWSQLGSDIDGEATGDGSGWSVSLNAVGTIVAIGAPYNSSSRGQVRVYQYISGSWSQLGTDIDGEAANDQSGFSVSLNDDGTIVAIGANLNDQSGKTDSGQVRVYQYISGSWTKVGQDIDGEATNDQSGYSVSLSSDGTRVAIGAPFNAGSKGQVRVYQQPQSPTINFSNMNKYLNDASFTLNPSSDSTGAFTYSSSNTNVASVSGNVVTIQQPGIATITATQAATNNYPSGTATAYVNIMNNICFPAGTPITCDQGNIPIDQLNPNVHTIRGKKIVAITQTITPDKFLVCFEKDSLGENVPSQKTLISKKHKVFYKGKMMEAQDFVGKFDTVYRVKYTGEILYNVLMEKYEKMMVNNLICETLHPENIVARLYTGNYSPSEFNEIVLSMNECVKKQDRKKFLSICKTLK